MKDIEILEQKIDRVEQKIDKLIELCTPKPPITVEEFKKGIDRIHEIRGEEKINWDEIENS